MRPRWRDLTARFTSPACRLRALDARDGLRRRGERRMLDARRSSDAMEHPGVRPAFVPGVARAHRGVASKLWPTAWRTRPRRTSSSTRTTRWTGTRGARRRSSGRAQEDKPILLSIGYSACHWCHVMERESFEDEQTAAYMNEHFVPVKLDREERPDLDAIYMEACQAMTGHGGWPLNVFLTPEQVPFYAGTYFPPEDRGGMPSWRRILEAVIEAWTEKRDQIRAGSDRVVERLRGGARARAVRPRCSTRDMLDEAAASLPDELRPGERRVRRRAEVPARLGDRVPAPPRRDRDDGPHAARDGLGRDVRPGRRRLRPLLGGRPLARPPLREDALRQRAARARVPARLAGDRRAALPDGVRGDARLGAARDARRRGRLLLRARRRLRGRGGQVLRLVAGGAARGRAATRRWRRSARPRRATSRARTSSYAPARLRPSSSGASTRSARSGSGPDSTTSG